MKICSYPECERPAKAKGYCNGHYQRIRAGRPLQPLQQHLDASKVSISEAFAMFAKQRGGCWGWTAGISSEGYARFHLGGVNHYGHRVSYELHFGPIPEGLFIDHMCHNRACVNPAHLQVATNKQNHENRPGPQANNTSGVRGVSWNKQAGRFEAYVKHWGVRHRAGNFRTLEEAEAAVIAKRNELYTNNLLDRSAS